MSGQLTAQVLAPAAPKSAESSAVVERQRVMSARPSTIATVQNDNAALVQLRVVGDGRAFVHALARAIVRAELIAAGVVPKPEPDPT